MTFVQSTPPQGALRNYDVCIIGGGPAGISIALRLATTGRRIALIEAGGIEPKAYDDTENPCRGHVTGLAYDLINSRVRAFGGTTGHWGGASRPLDEIDFRPKSFPGGLKGWPIARRELEPYFLAAADWVRISPPVFEIEAFDGANPYAAEFFDNYDVRFRTRLKRHSSPPVRFGEQYRPNVAATENIDCYLNSVAVRLDQSGERIERIQINSQESEFTIEANLVVLAAGGIESPRLMLASTGISPKGIGNESGFVGRCFGDHIVLWGAYLRASVPVPHRFRHVNNELILFGLSFADDYIIEKGYPNFSLIATPHEERGYVGDAYIQSLKTLDGGGDNRESEFLILSILPETTPNIDSRITLTQERDRFGLPRVNLDWRINEADFDAIRQIFQDIALLIGEKGLGRVQLYHWDTEELRNIVPRQWHHMGTLRMSDDPGTGVVDRNCKVHELDNLFVAGNAVFPTFGYTNPTLNILALSLRLADHLIEKVM